MQMAEERERSWALLPRLALQRWDEAISSVSPARHVTRTAPMHRAHV